MDPAEMADGSMATGRRRWLVADLTGVGAAALAVAAALAPGPTLGLGSRPWVMVASTVFVLLGLVSLARVRCLPAVPVLVGLVHCWLGDFLGPVNFTLGGLAFLAGHLWFAAAFCLRGLAWQRSLAAAGALAATGGLLGAWLLPWVHGADRALVLAYMAVISLMVAMAAGTRGGRGLALLAASLFYVSDIVVADWRFVGSAIRHDVLCYPLYYAACVLLALWPQAAFGGRVPAPASPISAPGQAEGHGGQSAPP